MASWNLVVAKLQHRHLDDPDRDLWKERAQVLLRRRASAAVSVETLLEVPPGWSFLNPERCVLPSTA